MSVRPIPEGYTTVTPYLIVRDAAQAIEFYKKAFNASELFRLGSPNGKIAHAEIQLGNARVMLADEWPEMGASSPESVGGTPVGICLYVEDVDRLFAQAVAAGANEERAVQDQFYGDRSGTLVDPFGHRWTIATHIEDVQPAEMEKRMAAFAKSAG